VPEVKQVSLYLDESYNSKYYIIGGIALNGSQMIEIESKWLSLQTEMREVLLREYPLARQSKKLIDGGLPEIKSNSLFKSSGYYALNDSGKKYYWEQQWDWLARAYQIGAESGGARTLIMLPPGTSGDRHITSAGLLSKRLSIGNGVPLSVRQKMDKIEADRHIRIVSMFYPMISSVLEKHNLVGNIIWDEHSLGNVISQLKAPQLLRSKGLFGRVLDNRFAVSENTPALQLADVISYIGRLTAQNQYGDSTHDAEFIEQLVAKYEFYSFSPADYNLWEVSLCRILAAEMVMVGSGGPADYQTLRDSVLPEILEFFYQEFQQEAFREERRRDGLAATHRPSPYQRVKQLFSGKGARTQAADWPEDSTLENVNPRSKP
jgi:Protein of unknown function (DUF3800)